ncbi:MAG TPA: four helix bundle protein [Gemmatimonadaceae bacterium]|nr:four helix bundle protein [Gemmatimonadaceae bacterium]
MSDHRDLKVFRVSNANALSLYKETRRIRGSDNLSIRSQLVRAAFSIPSNLVEGNKAATPKKFRQHVQTAIDSSHELDYHLETVRDLELLTTEKASNALKTNEEVRKMLSGLWSYLDRKVREDEEKTRKKKTQKQKPEEPDLC